MKLLTCTWCDVEEYLKKQTGIIIPIGSIEQHGPSGFIGTDTICAEAICEKVSEKYNVIIGPTISIAIAQHHMSFAGTITLRPTTLISMLNDIINSLQMHGFRHIYFINGHGGNIATIKAAFTEYYATFSLNEDNKNSCVKCSLFNTWESKTIEQVCKKYFDGVEGCHATASEISITKFIYPGLLENKKAIPEVAPAYCEFYDSKDYRNRYPDGRIGSNPNLATKEIGKEILSNITDEIWEEFSKFLER